MICSLTEVVVEKPKVNKTEKIKITRKKDEKVVRVVKEMKKVVVKMLGDDEWQIKEELVLKEGKVYVLKNKKLRVKII